jgi:hypothetical protein
MPKEYLQQLEQDYDQWIQILGLSPYRTVDRAYAWCREQSRLYGPYVDHWPSVNKDSAGLSA